MEKTLSIIKPDAIRKKLSGKINSKIEAIGLKIIAQKLIMLTCKQAKSFYYEHASLKFFQELVDFMTSGPVIVQVLEGENAVATYRKIMGATDPKKADPNTLRYEFADSIEANAVHGSDSLANAEREIAFFFSQIEILS